MTAEQEAKRLVEKHYHTRSNSASDITMAFAKWGAKISVNEIIKVLEESNAAVGSMQLKINYWQEVKTKIEKL